MSKWAAKRLVARMGYLAAHVPHMLIGAAIVLGFPHLVTADEYGRFAVSFAFVYIAGAIFYGWLQLSMVRLAGGTDELGSPSLATVIWGVLVPVPPCMIIGGILSFIGLLHGWMPSVIAACGFNAATSISQMARGLHKPKLYGVIGAARLSFVLGVALFFTRFSATKDSLLYSVGLGSIFAAAIGLFGASGELNSISRCESFKPKISLQYLLVYGIPASLSLIAIMTMLNGDRFMLGLLCDPAAVAAYSAQSGIARQVIYPAISAFGISIVPNAILSRRNESEGAAVSTALMESGQILTVIAPILAITVVFGDRIAVALLPYAYRSGAILIVPLSSLAAYAMGCRLVRYDPIFHVMLRPRSIAKCAIAALLTWVIALYPAVRYFGSVGAASVGLLAALTANVVAIKLIQYEGVRATLIPRTAAMILVTSIIAAWGVRQLLNGHLYIGGLCLVSGCAGILMTLYLKGQVRAAS
jgi:O-antigen/teichoic acid export membrane protein